MATTDAPMAAESHCDEDSEDTQSLTPSIIDYPTHWGRRYHKFKEGSYLYPNDEIESERLDFQHYVLKRLHGDRLFFAPLTDPRRIVDIGTGTGIWPIELADAETFPSARIIGTDLSPIQPRDVPANVSFEVQDCSEHEWHRPLRSIDYVHTRMMLGSLASFSSFVRNTRRYLRPGTGWLECHEVYADVFSDDNSIPPQWPLKEWYDKYDRATTMRQPPRPAKIADKISTWMRQAGYVDIQEHITKIPVGTWPRDKELKWIGRAWQENHADGLSAFSYMLFGSEGLGWSRTEIEVFLAKVRQSMGDRGVHAYQKMYVVYGRRPSEEEERRTLTARGG